MKLTNYLFRLAAALAIVGVLSGSALAQECTEGSKIERALCKALLRATKPLLQTPPGSPGQQATTLSTESSVGAVPGAVDCKMQAGKIEQVICKYPTLVALDEENARLRVRAHSASTEYLRDSDKQYFDNWAKNMREQCDTAECVGRSFLNFNATMRKALQKRRVDISDIPAIELDSANIAWQLAKELPPPAPEPRARLPKNPSGWANCTIEGLSNAQYQICENRITANHFAELDAGLGKALRRLDRLKASVKNSERDKAVYAAGVLWSQPEVACPNLDSECIKRATLEAMRKADEVTSAAESQLLPLQKAANTRYFQQKDAMPLVITNGGGGNKRRDTGEYITTLSVENHTGNAFSEIAVSCGLFEDWGDEKSVEPEFSHTIRAGIAPNSRTPGLGYVNVPWDLNKWGTDAQVIKCRVVSTKAASAAEAKAAIEQNQAQTALLRQRTEAFMKAQDEDRERTRRDESANQVTRLLSALGAVRQSIPGCQGLADAYRGQVATIRVYEAEAVRAPQVRGTAISLVNGMIADLRRSGCL